MHLIDGRRTMKRMVALTESPLNESYVEPSPYAWLRSRASVPTLYAPACEPLYTFREVLKNRASRARGMATSCTGASECKFSICIEIWQLVGEDCTSSAGFKAKAWKNNQRIVVGFPGTDDASDAAVDALNGFSIPTGQYKSAFKVADWAVQTFGASNVEFTGHSLGGGLSAVASYRTGRPSTSSFGC